MNNVAVLNKKHLRGPVPNSLYIGRPSIWGNPYAIGRNGTRDDVIAKYEVWIMSQPALLARLPELRGKYLICWCAPLRCHGEVLQRLTNTAAIICD